MPNESSAAGERYRAWPAPVNGAAIADGGRIAAPSPALFDPAHYGANATPVAVGGRRSAWFVADDFGQGVLRHYRRGGAVARISREAYIWLGEARTRSFMEFRLLAQMFDAGLPVPRPLAAAYWRRGLAYRAAIIVERLAHVRTLAQCLEEAHADAAALAVVAMHRFGVWHADLNAFNILIDQNGRAWLIDFDRGQRKALSDAERENNLLRLRRSLEKVAGVQGVAHWERLHETYLRAWIAAGA